MWRGNPYRQQRGWVAITLLVPLFMTLLLCSEALLVQLHQQQQDRVHGVAELAYQFRLAVVQQQSSGEPLARLFAPASDEASVNHSVSVKGSATDAQPLVTQLWQQLIEVSRSLKWEFIAGQVWLFVELHSAVEAAQVSQLLGATHQAGSVVRLWVPDLAADGLPWLPRQGQAQPMAADLNVSGAELLAVNRTGAQALTMGGLTGEQMTIGEWLGREVDAARLQSPQLKQQNGQWGRAQVHEASWQQVSTTHLAAEAAHVTAAESELARELTNLWQRAQLLHAQLAAGPDQAGSTGAALGEPGASPVTSPERSLDLVLQ